MTSYGAKELAESSRTVRKNTIQIAEDIPEDKYGFSAAPDTRTVAQLLAHIAFGNGFQRQIHAVERRTTLDGIDFPGMLQKLWAEEKKSRNKAEIIKVLHSTGEDWAAWLDSLSNEFLAERVQMPHGSTATKSRLEMLLSVKEHEMHHRAQLMLIERMIGIVPHLTREMQARMAPAAKA
ncbi:MAG: hypothetical protein A3F68_02185 [Acidobacteria bacterium RIFCSPLOWO2_12_FULL_54_10]|nr:MAG: hypothetical protein A3F68_02185 [Acidobacteria bacterium RIFCSPLOWO2_12_FULL_54_10]